MSEIADPFCIALADYLSEKLSVSVHFRSSIDASERHQLLDNRWRAVKAVSDCWVYRPCVAPCMVGEETAVYYAEVIVHKDSKLRTIAELRHASWTYNEEESFSDFQIMRELLVKIGEPGRYFDVGFVPAPISSR